WVKCHAHCQQRDILDVLELDWRDLRVSSAGKDRSQRLRAPDLDTARPVEFAWKDRVPIGRLSIVVGNEGTGKGTVIADITSKLTRGTLAGNLKDAPCNVLILGSEDLLDSVWTPRLHLANADLGRVRFQEVGDFELDFTDEGDIEHLRGWIQRYEIKALILDALLDHVGGANTDEYKPRQVRSALGPLRRLAGEEEVAVIGAMDPRKGKVQTVGELVGGRHQLKAVSRAGVH